MQILVRCSRCNRQADVSGRAPGESLSCRCGQPLVVPAVSAGEAAVVRCSSCGAPREAGAERCGACGSDFTIYEKDMERICPTCFRRVSRAARFCSGCGGVIVPEETGDEGTDRLCPACGDSHRLASRPLGESGLSVLECERCGGLWLAEEAFEQLLERARLDRDPAPEATALGSGREAAPAQPGSGSFYRRCPVCSARMNRKNFGKRSGVILDQCKDHGTWFDATELPRVLAWIRSGGEKLSEDTERDEERAALAAARFRVEPKAPEDAWPPRDEKPWSSEQSVLSILVRLFLGKAAGHLR